MKSILLLILSCFLTSCSLYYGYIDRPDTEKDQSGLEKPSAELLSKISFNEVMNEVFAAKCIACHGSSGGVNLESYESARRFLREIERSTLIERRMPKSPYPQLTKQERLVLRAWIDAGGPELPKTGEPPPVVEPPPVIEPPPDSGGPITDEQLSYAFVNREVFRPRCIECHGASGGVNLQTYGQVKANLSAVHRTALVEKTMPEDGPLTSRQSEILLRWIAIGAPLDGGSSDGGHGHHPPEPGEPPPPPPPAELEATYASIRKNILQVKCLVCHKPGGKAENIPMVTKEELLNSPLEIVIPGNPEESMLMIVLQEDARKFMPPKESGIAPLTEKQIKVIEKWIKDGAKD